MFNFHSKSLEHVCKLSEFSIYFLVLATLIKSLENGAKLTADDEESLKIPWNTTQIHQKSKNYEMFILRKFESQNRCDPTVLALGNIAFLSLLKI